MTSAILFYNVENLFDTRNDPGRGDDEFLPESKKRWLLNRYHRKLRHIARVITSVEEPLPLLTGLAEVENYQVLHDLVLAMGVSFERVGVVHHDSPDERGMDVALLYDKERITLLSSESLPVVFRDDPADTTRDILFVEGEVRSAATARDVHRLLIYVNHWPSRREGTAQTMPRRMAAARVLRDHLQSHLDEDPRVKAIVMGDFNCTPADPPLKRILDREHCEGGVLMNLGWPIALAGEGSTCYRSKWLLFDQILATPALISDSATPRLDPASFRVVKHPWMLFYHPVYKEYRPDKTFGGRRYQGGYSDHLPVTARLFL